MAGSGTAEAARRRETGVVLLWRLDRGGRSAADLLAPLQELDHLGAGFVSLNEVPDPTTPAGRAMAALWAVFAEFKREIPRERLRAGMAHARQDGKKLGRVWRRRHTLLSEAAFGSPRLSVWRSRDRAGQVSSRQASCDSARPWMPLAFQQQPCPAYSHKDRQYDPRPSGKRGHHRHRRGGRGGRSGRGG